MEKLQEEKKEAERISSAEKNAPGRKATITPKDVKGKGAQPEVTTPTKMPEVDPTDPNKNKVVPDCASLDLTTIRTMSQLLKYFVHADTLDDKDGQQVSVVIHDNQVDSHRSTEIVDFAQGLGAEYLVLRGCQKMEKFNKVQRYCEIKSA